MRTGVGRGLYLIPPGCCQGPLSRVRHGFRSCACRTAHASLTPFPSMHRGDPEPPFAACIRELCWDIQAWNQAVGHSLSITRLICDAKCNGQTGEMRGPSGTSLLANSEPHLGRPVQGPSVGCWQSGWSRASSWEAGLCDFLFIGGPYLEDPGTGRDSPEEIDYGRRRL